MYVGNWLKKDNIFLLSVSRLVVVILCNKF